ALAAQDKTQDKYTLKAPNGVAFSEFKGYEEWQDVAVSRTDTTVKAILGNSAMIKAYKSGIPGNGKAFPDGVKIVKIMWSKKANPLSPYAVEIPDALTVVAFIEKDSKRFPDTSGWGYAQFNYDAKSSTFTPYGKDASFGKAYCYDLCHSKVKATDYIFTNYAPR
ncbi:MAG: cytochrome P460 family protein, partial [Candidatus Acidiferrales bacterium]